MRTVWIRNGKRSYDVVDEVDGVGPVVLLVDLARSYSCRVVDRGVREAPDLATCRIDEVEELHVELDVVPMDLLLVADHGRHRALVAVDRQAVDPVSNEHGVDTARRDLDAEVALEVPNDLVRAEVVDGPQADDLVLDRLGRAQRVILLDRAGLPTSPSSPWRSQAGSQL